MTKLKTDASLLQSCVSVSVTDLRIGNLVEYNGMIMKISEICSPKPLKDKRYSDKYIIELFDGAGLLNCTLDEIKGIAITEEILLKLGFEVIYRSNFTLRLDYKENFKFWAGWNLVNGHFHIRFIGEQFTNIKFIHELQNLYFSITGSELQIGNLTEH